MAVQCDGGGINRDDIKNHFITREGAYKVITFSEYRPSRPGCMAQCQSFPVRVSFVALPADNSSTSTIALNAGTSSSTSTAQNATAAATPNAVTNMACTGTAGTMGGACNAINTVGSSTGGNGPGPGPGGGGGCGGGTGCGTGTGSSMTMSNNSNNNGGGGGDRICFNVGRELYVYMYKGLRKAADLTKPIDKRVYKGTYPTCHDFNVHTMTSRSVSLLVGFSAGQIQLIDPIKKELSKLFNEERLIDKSKVTCVKWLPGSPSLFLVAHTSGQMYVYNEELTCGNTPPAYQLFKQGDGFSIYTCKTKSTRNPLYRWVVGEGALHEFAFSPCCRYVATVSQDGFLRVFNYDTMDLVGVARSYFGGLLCVCWSPDGKYVVTGGEDDLVTVWSFAERRVVARGHGHKSWVSVVSFDAYTTHTYSDETTSSTSTGNVNSVQQCFDFGGCDGDQANDCPQQQRHQQHPYQHRPNGVPAAWMSNNVNPPMTRSNNNNPTNPMNTASSTSSTITCYRFGSVGQDTQLCLWDLTEDVLKQPLGRSRTTVLLGNCCSASSAPSGQHPVSTSQQQQQQLSTANVTGSKCSGENPHCASNCVGPASIKESSTPAADGHMITSSNAVTASKFSLSLSLSGTGGATAKQTGEQTVVKEHKRNFSLTSRNSDKNSSVIKSSSSNHHQKGVGIGPGGQQVSSDADPVMRLIGTTSCPRLDEVPLLEPLVCKKVAHERLTALVFREECIVSACQEGFICTWARPGRGANNNNQGSAVAGCGGGAGAEDRSASPT